MGGLEACNQNRSRLGDADVVAADPDPFGPDLGTLDNGRDRQIGVKASVEELGAEPASAAAFFANLRRSRASREQSERMPLDQAWPLTIPLVTRKVDETQSGPVRGIISK